MDDLAICDGYIAHRPRRIDSADSPRGNVACSSTSVSNLHSGYGGIIRSSCKLLKSIDPTGPPYIICITGGILLGYIYLHR